MRNKNMAWLGCVAIVVGTLAGVPARAEDVAQVKKQIEVEVQFTDPDGGTTNLLSVPKVTTKEGQEATIKIVREWPCPNGEVVEEGVIVCVTPAIEGDTVMLKGSAHSVEAIQPEEKKAEKTVKYVCFKEVKAYFAVSVKDPDKRYCLGPFPKDGEQIEVWLKARLIKPSEPAKR